MVDQPAGFLREGITPRIARPTTPLILVSLGRRRVDSPLNDWRCPLRRAWGELSATGGIFAATNCWKVIHNPASPAIFGCSRNRYAPIRARPPEPGQGPGLLGNSPIGAGGGTRTHTAFYGPRILSPVRLPFRHTGNPRSQGLRPMSLVQSLRPFRKEVSLLAWIPGRERGRGAFVRPWRRSLVETVCHPSRCKPSRPAPGRNRRRSAQWVPPLTERI